MKPSKCDACGKRMRASHHEFHLADPRTGQRIGRYHAGAGVHEECMAQAYKYFTPGTVIRGIVVHPDRCGADYELCDMGTVVA